LRSALVVAEIAIALVLLAAPACYYEALEKMRNVDLGFRPERVATALILCPSSSTPPRPPLMNFNYGLLRRLRQLPGVQDASLTSGFASHGRLWAMRPSSWTATCRPKARP